MYCVEMWTESRLKERKKTKNLRQLAAATTTTYEYFEENLYFLIPLREKRD